MLDNFDLSDLALCYRYIKHQFAAESFCTAAMGAVANTNLICRAGCRFFLQRLTLPALQRQHCLAGGCSAADGVNRTLSPTMAGRSFSMAGSAIKGVSLCSTTSISVIFPSATVTSNTSLPPNPPALLRWVPSPTLIANVGLPAASPDSACSTAANTALLVAVAPLTASTGP